MAQQVNGQWFDVPANWTPVIVVRPESVVERLIGWGRWLDEHCSHEDHDAYRYDDTHTIYFFRDPEVAVWFRLRF